VRGRQLDILRVNQTSEKQKLFQVILEEAGLGSGSLSELLRLVSKEAAEGMVKVRESERHVVIQAVSEVVNASVALPLNVAGEVVEVQAVKLAHIPDYGFVEDIAAEGTTIWILLWMSLASVRNYKVLIAFFCLFGAVFENMWRNFVVFFTEGEIKRKVLHRVQLGFVFQIITANVRRSRHFIAIDLFGFLVSMKNAIIFSEYRLVQRILRGESACSGEFIGTSNALGLRIDHLQTALERTIIISEWCLASLSSHRRVKLGSSSNWTTPIRVLRVRGLQF
jgi:hypothetical protein